MEIINELKKLPVSEWAKIWCALNKWEFPEQLNHIKPDWWDSEPTKETQELKFRTMSHVMDLIKSTIGDKACNREWNRDIMTDEQHEVFWRTKDSTSIIKF